MFRSAESALLWAAQVNTLVDCKQSSIYKMLPSHRSSTNNALLQGLTLRECKMQANNIFDMSNRLSDEVLCSYIAAKYKREDGIDKVQNRVMGRLMYGGTISNRGIRKLVLMYMFNHRVTKRELREELQCGSDKVADYHKRVFEILDVIHTSAIGELEGLMIESEIVEGVKSAVSC